MSCPAKIGVHSFCCYERLIYILQKQNTKYTYIYDINYMKLMFIK